MSHQAEGSSDGPVAAQCLPPLRRPVIADTERSGAERLVLAGTEHPIRRAMPALVGVSPGSGAPVMSAYGMTETTHRATSEPLPKHGPEKEGSVGTSTIVSIRLVDVLEYREEHLARFEVPDGIELVSELPHTAKGALDRQALVDRYSGG